MDKPTTLSVKDWIIRNMSTEMSIQERIIHAVIDHQFNSARLAMDTGTSIEFSGFGKFMFNRKRAVTKYLKFLHMKEGMEYIINDEKTDDKKRGYTQFKLGFLLGDIKLLERKIKSYDDKH